MWNYVAVQDECTMCYKFKNNIWQIFKWCFQELVILDTLLAKTLLQIQNKVRRVCKLQFRTAIIEQTPPQIELTEFNLKEWMDLTRILCINIYDYLNTFVAWIFSVLHILMILLSWAFNRDCKFLSNLNPIILMVTLTLLL